MSLSNVFRTANVWKSFDNSKCLDGKIRQKVVFFDGGTRLGRFGVVVLCVCRPSSRLCLSMLRSFVHIVLQLDLQAVFLLNTRPCIDFNPYL